MQLTFASSLAVYGFRVFIHGSSTMDDLRTVTLVGVETKGTRRSVTHFRLRKEATKFEFNQSSIPKSEFEKVKKDFDPPQRRVIVSS